MVRLLLLSLLLVGATANAALKCPTQIAFTCKKYIGKYTLCTYANGPWYFSAPSVQPNNTAMSVDPHHSKSILPAGSYTASYQLSVYAPLTTIKTPSAYCVYTVNNAPAAIAGLYNTNYRKAKGPWKKQRSNYYTCKGAGRCIFRPK